jgi:ketosteroid isomerase-like protein
MRDSHGTPKAGGATQRVNGKYILILERTAAAAWKVARFIFNSSEPLSTNP